MSNNNYEYKIEEVFGKLNISKNWEIKVTKTCWYDKKVKYDIRKWKKDGNPGKGISITKDQLEQIFKILEKNIFYPNDFFEVNDVVENITNNKRGKVKKIDGYFLIVNTSCNSDNEKWEKNSCKYIKQGKTTYQKEQTSE